MSDERCVNCRGPQYAGKAASKLLKLSIWSIEPPLPPQDVAIHPACVAEWLDANPELALTSRRDAMVEATERMAGETSSEFYHRQSASRIRDDAALPSIDDERGYPGVESLGVPLDL